MADDAAFFLPPGTGHPGAPHIRAPGRPAPNEGAGVDFASDFGQWVKTGQWEHVSSSNVQAIAYDAKNERLRVRYKGGVEWEYWPITLEIAASLYRTGSKGVWIWDYLKKRGKGGGQLHQVNARAL